MAQSAPAPRKSNKLEEITSLAWNTCVPHILASGSSNGMIVIWDVRTEKEIICMNTGHRTSVSSLAWNPEIVSFAIHVVESSKI
jgi:WD40 repeat protein